jgi:hypothetical protein
MEVILHKYKSERNGWWQKVIVMLAPPAVTSPRILVMKSVDHISGKIPRFLETFVTCFNFSNGVGFTIP